MLLAGLILIMSRGQQGGDLGLILGPGGYVLGVREELRALMGGTSPVQPDDRLVTVAGRHVNSVAEIGDVLRALDPDSIPDDGDAQPPRPAPAVLGGEPLPQPPEGVRTVSVTVERSRHRFTELLIYEEVLSQGLPATVAPDDRVVAYDNHPVDGDVTQDTLTGLLAQHPGEGIVVVFERPVLLFGARLPLTDPPWHLWPLMVMVVALVAVWSIGRLGRQTQDPALQVMWSFLALSVASGPWVLVVLFNPSQAMRDPALLAISLTALALFRPLVMDVHRRLWGGAGMAATSALIFPALVMAFVGLGLCGLLAPSLWGSTVDPGAEFEVARFLQVSAALMALYQLLDLALWLRMRPQRDQDRSRAFRGPEVGLVAASVPLVTALLHGLSDGAGFVQGGFIYHAAAMTLALWLGDMALMVAPPEGRLGGRPASFMAAPDEARARLLGYLREVARALRVPTAELVIVRGKLAMVMTPVDDDDLEPAPRGMEQWSPGLVIERADEPVRAAVGLLRDEQVTLPLPPREGKGRAELRGEQIMSDDVVRAVVDGLDIHLAFCLLDEAAEFAYPTHAQREQSFYVYLIVRGRPAALGGLEEMRALREGFEAIWPYTRQLLVEGLLEELGGGAWLDSETRTFFEAEHAKTLAARAPAPPEPEPEPAAPAAPAPPPVTVALAPPPLTFEEQMGLREVPFLRRDVAERYPVHEPELLEPWLEEHLELLARADAPVLLFGPPGIGKAFAARRIAAHSAQRSGPFVAFSATSCPPSLQRLELLGDGNTYGGHLSAALGGVLYVKDADALTEDALDQLLRTFPQTPQPVMLMLAARTSPLTPTREAVEHVGGLLGELARGVLSHQVVVLDPLHHRHDQIQRLADFYLIRLAMKHSRRVTHTAPSTLRALEQWTWFAGVVELKAALEVAVLRCHGQTLFPEHLSLPGAYLGAGAPHVRPEGGPLPLEHALRGRMSAGEDLTGLLYEVQAWIYAEALEREGGNKTAAARLIGVKRSTFVRRLKRFAEEALGPFELIDDDDDDGADDAGDDDAYAQPDAPPDFLAPLGWEPSDEH